MILCGDHGNRSISYVGDLSDANFIPLRRIAGAAQLTWTAVSGRGTLFSWSVLHYAWIPQFKEQLPFVTGLVAIEEDPAVRVVSYIVDCAPEQLRCEMPVR